MTITRGLNRRMEGEVLRVEMGDRAFALLVAENANPRAHFMDLEDGEAGRPE